MLRKIKHENHTKLYTNQLQNSEKIEYCVRVRIEFSPLA